MDGIQSWWPGAVVFVLLVLGTGLRRGLSPWAERKGREKGMNYGEQLADHLAVSGIAKSAKKVGQALVFPDAVAGRAVVDRCLDATRHVVRIDASSWHLGFAYPDDLTVVYRTGAAGGTLAVSRARESLGGLNGDRRWVAVLEKVGQEAAAAGVTVEPGSVTLVATDEVDQQGRMWRSEVAGAAADG